MARPERNARHDDRAPAIDPYFGPGPYTGGAGVSYSSANDLDPTGYSVSDVELLHRVAGDPVSAEVKAPLGGPMVGRLAVSSYGDAEGPTPGGALEDLGRYQRGYEVLAAGGRGIEGDGGGAEPPVLRGGLPGGASVRSGLGLPWGTDDTCYDGPGMGMSADPLYLTEQHAMGRAPIEYSEDPYSGVVPEHLQARINRFTGGIYDGGDAVGFGRPRGSSVRGDVGGRTGEDGPGFPGGGDYGDESPSEELALIRRQNDSGDEFAGDGWGKRVPSALERRSSRSSDFDR